LRTLSSTGSIPAAWASSSIAVSSAAMPVTTPGPRMGQGELVLSGTIL
jgi:hypothetical protein